MAFRPPNTPSLDVEIVRWTRARHWLALRRLGTGSGGGGEWWNLDSLLREPACLAVVGGGDDDGEAAVRAFLQARLDDGATVLLVKRRGDSGGG